MFNIHDKVVCIDDAMSEIDASCYSERLVNGRVYLVRGFTTPDAPGDTPGLLLAGITAELHHSGEEFSFCQSRFRKLGAHCEAASAVKSGQNQAEDAP